MESSLVNVPDHMESFGIYIVLICNNIGLCFNDSIRFGKKKKKRLSQSLHYGMHLATMFYVFVSRCFKVYISIFFVKSFFSLSFISNFCRFNDRYLALFQRLVSRKKEKRYQTLLCAVHLATVNDQTEIRNFLFPLLQ